MCDDTFTCIIVLIAYRNLHCVMEYLLHKPQFLIYISACTSVLGTVYLTWGIKSPCNPNEVCASSMSCKPAVSRDHLWL